MPERNTMSLKVNIMIRSPKVHIPIDMPVEFGLICIISLVSPYLELMKKIFDQKDNNYVRNSKFIL